MNIRIRIEMGPRSGSRGETAIAEMGPRLAAATVAAAASRYKLALHDSPVVRRGRWLTGGLAVAAAGLVFLVLALPHLRSSSASHRAAARPGSSEPSASESALIAVSGGKQVSVTSTPEPVVAARTAISGSNLELALASRAPAAAAAPVPATKPIVVAPSPQALVAPAAQEAVALVAKATRERSATTGDEPSCQSFLKRPWLAPVALCTQAFTAAPSASLALLLAHANWSRGNKDDVSSWANRAIELGATNPDAYVLLGHAERRLGHAEAAAAAYHHYLEMAPHGWHAANVRSALRELGETSPARETSLSVQDR